ncbi:MAG: integrase [Sphingobacteriaceae bacterium]|nr:MAG: integrase [Sphingobacteriaceae bacterium]
MHLDLFYNYILHEKRFSSNTLTAYKADLRQYFSYVAANDNASFTDVFLIRNWIVQLMDQKIDSRSVKRKITSLKTYFRFLVRENLIQDNPMSKIQSPKLAKKLPSVIREENISSLLDSQEIFETDFFGIRDKLVIEILFGTGLRLAELLSLRETDINWYENTIKILGKRSKERIVPLNKELVTLIKQYIAVKEIEIFDNNSLKLIVTHTGSDAYPKLIYRIVQKYLSYVTTQNKKSPHVLRHTFATSLLNNGADLNAIKELLGHTNLSATQIYTHNSVEKLKLIYKQAHPKA